ncbi:hypothetical protein [Methanorbis rubei]|uniref:FeoB-associated Cys-rich membrane protein n=1 Tax=Methanorbis rubei TaxID=3028300 RepID=A0AAE4MHR8_9EURY|nr:hypothetical protein [Methanocorpusculaceae archaeon Cs1]
MDSDDPFWTVLFVLLAVAILLVFGLMLKRNLSQGSCCCGCSKKDKGGCCQCAVASREASSEEEYFFYRSYAVMSFIV